MRQFSKRFTQQEALSKDAINAAVEVMNHGRLHRYNVHNEEVAEAAKLEEEFAQLMGSKYCLAVASGGYAIACALRAIGVRTNEKILSNAFTLAPVPGAIVSVGAQPVLVESNRHLTIDFNDLESKAKQSGAQKLVLSHMRGHICDMEILSAICKQLKLILIEDCAHTMGAYWNGTPSGKFGLVSCFSTQTYKHINSGEGGLLVSDCSETMAKAIILSGSYMLYNRHQSRPSLENFEAVRLHYPNCSGRMDNLRAAILRPQLVDLPKQCRKWNRRYYAIANKLKNSPVIEVIERSPKESFVGSSIQFFVLSDNPQFVSKFLDLSHKRGVELKWFGDKQPKGYTSRFDSWQYIVNHECPNTINILDHLFDMRIPLTFTEDDCKLIGEIIVESANTCQ